MVLFIYAGLIFLVLRFSVTLFNFLSNPKLGHYGKHYSDLVSVVIFSTKDDESCEDMLRNLNMQDYENIEVLVKRPGMKTEEVVTQANGKYLLFLKEKLIVNKGLINSLIYRVKTYGLTLVSLVPNRKTDRFFDWCLSPLNDFVLINIFPMRLVRLINIPAFFVASQPCMFFDAAKYKQEIYGGYEGRQKMELLQANKLVYLGDGVDLDVVGRAVLKIFGNNIPVGIIYLGLVLVCPVVIIVNFDFAFWALPVGLIFLTRIMISFLTGQNPVVNLLLHPVQMVMLFVVILKASISRLLTLTRHKI